MFFFFLFFLFFVLFGIYKIYEFGLSFFFFFFLRTLLNKIDNRILRRWSRRRFGCFFFFSLSVFHWFELRKKEREEFVEEVVEKVVEEKKRTGRENGF